MLLFPSVTGLLRDGHYVRLGPFLRRDTTVKNAVYYAGDLNGHSKDAQHINGNLVRVCGFAAWGPLGGLNDIVHIKMRSAEVLVQRQCRLWVKCQAGGQQLRWRVHGACKKFAQLVQIT
jgi:hypothetical protein